MKRNSFALSFIASCIALVTVGKAKAGFTWNEINAGGTVNTAENITGSGTVSLILGGMGDDNDVDVFRLTFKTFGNLTLAALGNNALQFSLLNSNGVGIANYRNLVGTANGVIPSSFEVGLQPDQTVYVVVSGTGNDPCGAGNMLLFPGTLLMANGPINNSPYAFSAGLPLPGTKGNYAISFQGDAFSPVSPTPGSVALGMAALALGVCRRAR